MTFKINRKRFYDTCRKAIKAAAPESVLKTLPGIGGILLEADSHKETLKLYCTDLNVTIMFILKDVDVTTGGKTVVTATLLTAILANYEIPGFEDIEITVDDGMMKLSCGKAHTRIHTLPAENFPNVNITYPANTICVSGLSQIVKQAVNVTTDKSDNPANDCVKVNFSSDKSVATATDTLRFIKTAGEQIADGDLEVLIPKRALNLVCGITKASDELFVGTTHNQIIFMTSEFVLSSRVYVSDKHNVEPLIKRVKPIYSAIVDAKAFCEAIDVSFVAIDDRDPCVNISLKEDHLHVFVWNGSEESDVEVEVTVDKCKPMNGEVFHYKPVYLYDFLRGCTGQVKVEFTDRGFMKLSNNLTDYILSPRKEPKPKEEKPEKEPKAEPKTKKPRATKVKKEETSADEAA
jgi:DNA polymerase III sliding clamp (beta) subunit (PCNA family)